MLKREMLTKTKRFTCFIILLLAFSSITVDKVYASTIFTIGSTQYVDDQQVIKMDVAPYIKDGRTFLPVRYVANALGIPDSDIMYDPASQNVVLTKGTRVVQVTIGSTLMLVNSATNIMDVVPEINAGRTCLPIAWVARIFAISVTWDAATRTVTLGGSSSPEQTLAFPSPNTQPTSRVVPSLQYDNIQTASNDFGWQYNGLNYTWHIEVPSALINWDRELQNYVADFYGGKSAQSVMLAQMSDTTKNLVLANTNGNYASWVNEANNSKWVGYVADDLATSAISSGYDYFHEAEFILSFIGSAIPYNITKYPELPAQTLIDSGDCKDKSILYAAILKSLGYKVALLDFPPPAGQNTGHMAVGIVFNDNQIPSDRKISYYLHNGIKYYFAETTSANWLIGQISDEKLETQGYVYPIN